MYQPLAPCASCSRHVRTDEGACPFCGAAVPEGFARAAIPGTTQRLSRAAAFVFGTTLALSGCASSAGGDDGAVTTDAPADRAVDATSDAAIDAGPADQGGNVAMYGLPAPVDAGPDDNGGGSADYGSPPPIDGR